MWGHATAHYFNYAKAPYYESEFSTLVAGDATHFYVGNSLYMAWNPGAPGRSAFVSVPSQDLSLSHGISAGFTGQLLLLVMVIIYAAANDKVKRSHYETFWYAHHFFILWFFFLLLHGPAWWFWSLFTLAPYTIDRLVRVFYRGNRRIALARVYFWGKPGKPDVMTLQFDNAVDDKGIKPVDYMEGHYLYLCCPAVETSTWNGFQEFHPFTISSAPDEPVLEVNIRVMPSPYSWTNKVARYLQLLDPNNTGEVELATRNPTTGVTTLGKVIGPDGKPFFRIDAPHGAPSQHCFQYDTVMLVGAGIGVTPCASIMKGVVGYRWEAANLRDTTLPLLQPEFTPTLLPPPRWKKGFTPNNLHFFWVARLTDLTTFKWLLVMLPELKAQQLVHNQYYGGDEAEQAQLRSRAGELNREVEGAARALAARDGWAQTQAALRLAAPCPHPPAHPPDPSIVHRPSQAPDGWPYWYDATTGETAWQPPGVGPGPTRLPKGGGWRLAQ